MTMEKEELKKAAGIEAAKFVLDGMNIGLGTGSTVRYTIIELGRRIREEGLKVRGIPTSRSTEELAKEHGIPLTDFGQVEMLDLTIDGADEVDQELNLTKGGGGALLREKIIAANSKRLIIVVDDAKLVEHLGTIYPLPVEITPFGWEATFRRFKTFNCDVQIRRTPTGDFYVSDNGNYILDCKFEIIATPELTERFISVIPGVVEVGLFVRMCDTLVVGTRDGVKIIGD